MMPLTAGCLRRVQCVLLPVHVAFDSRGNEAECARHALGVLRARAVAGLPHDVKVESRISYLAIVVVLILCFERKLKMRVTT